MNNAERIRMTVLGERAKLRVAIARLENFWLAKEVDDVIEAALVEAVGRHAERLQVALKEQEDLDEDQG